MVSCQKGPTRHAYACRWGPFGRIPSKYVIYTLCVRLWDISLFLRLHEHFRYENLSLIPKHEIRLFTNCPPFCYFLSFFNYQSIGLLIEYRVHIWQMTQQLSCGGTCQILMWLKQNHRYFWKIENFSNGESNERRFRKPRPVHCFEWYHQLCRTNSKLWC